MWGLLGPPTFNIELIMLDRLFVCLHKEIPVRGLRILIEDHRFRIWNGVVLNLGNGTLNNNCPNILTITNKFVNGNELIKGINKIIFNFWGKEKLLKSFSHMDV